jgi:beta-1,4-mannosyl-glycoprotein beta-1,4-N-acetylglucosaminyltransferase
VVLVDVFLANDELRLAEFRIKYMSNHVDRVLIGESSRTFSGLSKRLNFTLKYGNASSSPDKRVRVIEIPVPQALLDASDRWAIEEFSRDYLLKTAMSEYPLETLIFSDLDEIPSLAQLKEMSTMQPGSIMDLKMNTLIRFANWEIQVPGSKWRKAKGLRAIDFSPGLRYREFPSFSATDGAHFSYLGLTASEIRRKYQSFSHAEYDKPELSNADLLEFCNFYQVNHTGRAHDIGFGLVEVHDMSELSDLQRAAIEFEPSWSNLDKANQNIPSRIAASWILTKRIHSPKAGREFASTPWRLNLAQITKNFSEAIAYRFLASIGLGRLVNFLARKIYGSETN